MADSTSEKSVFNESKVVQMQNISVHWGNNKVLDGFNLDMTPGERIAIVGPSGCGKSTTLRVLAGLLLPNSGNLKLFGKQQHYLRLDQNSPPDVRLVFQNPALLGSLTIKENVGFILRKNQQINEDQMNNLIKESLREVGLFDVEDKLPSELSGGMQKRVSFARALIGDNAKTTSCMPLLLFDEPTAGLDPVACTRIEDLIVKTTNLAKGCSIIVSHVMSTIERSAERVLMLYGGKIQWDGSIKEFKKTQNPYIQQFRSGSLKGPMQHQEI